MKFSSALSLCLALLATQGCGPGLTDDPTEALDSDLTTSTPRLRLRGRVLPEAASLGVKAPDLTGSSWAKLTLDVKDGDAAREGQLVVNGRCTIPLFGSYIRGNEVRFTYSFEIATSCLNSNVYNDLKFVHLRGDGFDVFYASLAKVVAAPPPTPTPVVQPRLRLRGSVLPEAASLGVRAPVLDGYSWAVVTFDVQDADAANEGELVVNSRCAGIPLFGSYAQGDEKRFQYSFELASFCLNSNTYNDFQFVHAGGDGFDVYNVTLKPTN